MSFDELLVRCLECNTQNNNKSLNSLNRIFVPKHLHLAKNTVEIVTQSVICIFNKGFKPLLNMMIVMGVTIRTETHLYVLRRDEERIDRSEHRIFDASKKLNCFVYRVLVFFYVIRYQ
ncbi:hypothetical protein WH47_06912 [Habropoda laboriosa]|uniref:Uncharacterized protein n=1 Tax=Habropoda laboriosa TaxID=597456 RepID=A0A0L7QQH3_9HYME|nr:hypothetical protein WH47_06912 [Habropoda laboriosa]